MEEAEEVDCALGLRCFGVVLEGEEFDRAGGEDEAFADGWWRRVRVASASRLEGIASRSRLGGVVVDAEEDETPLWLGILMGR